MIVLKEGDATSDLQLSEASGMFSRILSAVFPGVDGIVICYTRESLAFICHIKSCSFVHWKPICVSKH